MSNEYKANVGKRVLIDWGIRSLCEVRILEVSPSGERAKIKADNFTDWIECWRHDIKEVLETQIPTP